MGKRLSVQRLQPFKRTVGIGVCLEISNKFLGVFIAFIQEIYTLIYLPGNGVPALAISRAEAFIVAKRTPAITNGAISVGAGETRVDANPLQAAPVFLPAPVCPRIKTPLVPPQMVHF